MQLATDALDAAGPRAAAGAARAARDPAANALTRDMFAVVLSRLALDRGATDGAGDDEEPAAARVDALLVAMECSGGLAKVGLHTKRFAFAKPPVPAWRRHPRS